MDHNRNHCSQSFKSTPRTPPARRFGGLKDLIQETRGGSGISALTSGALSGRLLTIKHSIAELVESRHEYDSFGKSCFFFFFFPARRISEAFSAQQQRHESSGGADHLRWRATGTECALGLASGRSERRASGRFLAAGGMPGTERGLPAWRAYVISLVRSDRGSIAGTRASHVKTRLSAALARQSIAQRRRHCASCLYHCRLTCVIIRRTSY